MASSKIRASQVMQVSISSITIPPRTPRGFAPNICSHPGAFASYLLPGGQEIVGITPEGRACVYKRFLPFLGFPLQWQELATDNTSGFICCSEILYVLKENYSILD